MGCGFSVCLLGGGRRRKVLESNAGRRVCLPCGYSAGLWGVERDGQSTIEVEPPKERAEPARVVMVDDRGIRFMGGIPKA